VTRKLSVSLCVFRALMAHPKIKEAAVIAIADENG
jgi:acyl-coenzyme A synthetase/AMP-(fatty) acid ligase